jgi:type IV pilus assembly protein PilX
MNRHSIKGYSRLQQGGAALAVSLILLTVITLLSLSAMRSANLNTKIAVNHQHKQFAFQAAESALANLLNLNSSDFSTLNVPADESTAATNNPNWFTATGVAHNATVSADLEMDLIEVSAPGTYKYSGYGLSVVSVRYQADAIGEVDGTNTTAHNRMEVHLVRD